MSFFNVGFILVLVCVVVALIEYFRTPDPARPRCNPGFWLTLGFLICAVVFVFAGKV